MAVVSETRIHLLGRDASVRGYPTLVDVSLALTTYAIEKRFSRNGENPAAAIAIAVVGQAGNAAF